MPRLAKATKELSLIRKNVRLHHSGALRHNRYTSSDKTSLNNIITIHSHQRRMYAPSLLISISISLTPIHIPI